MAAIRIVIDADAAMSIEDVQRRVDGAMRQLTFVGFRPEKCMVYRQSERFETEAERADRFWREHDL